MIAWFQSPTSTENKTIDSEEEQEKLLRGEDGWHRREEKNNSGK